jgi:hypothetical protein
MSELIRNAWTGWQEYKGAGKFAVLLMALYLFLFIKKNTGDGDIRNTITDKSKTGSDRIRTLYTYTGVMAVLCIFPLTAAVLMLYQTKFYNYEWIWGYVPQTCVLAVGAGGVLGLVWKKRYKTPDRIKAALITMMLAGVLLVSGSINVWNTEEESTKKQSYDRTAALIENIKDIENMADRTICLWAPEEIMAHAREYSAEITLAYGRNMWDNALNAYSYDTYTKEYEDMYQWMELLELCGEISTIYGSEEVDYDRCVENALEAGVNVIVLPENTTEETLLEIEETTGTQSVVIDGYYVILI